MDAWSQSFSISSASVLHSCIVFTTLFPATGQGAPDDFKRFLQEQKSHSTSLMPVRASGTGKVCRHSEQVTAMVPLSFFTQTAALVGLPISSISGELLEREW